MDDILRKLFDSHARVKIMRLFLLNPETVFESSEVRLKSRISSRTAISELARLRLIGFIKKKNEYREVSYKKEGKIIIKKKRINGLILDESFPNRSALQGLLLSGESFRREAIASRFIAVGKVKLLIISGVFIQDEDSPVDILLVGDNIKKSLLGSTLKVLESETGKELRYAVFETEDFSYRLGMHDKFVRDIINSPHEKLIDKIGISV